MAGACRRWEGVKSPSKIVNSQNCEMEFWLGSVYCEPRRVAIARFALNFLFVGRMRKYICMRVCCIEFGNST